ncbi:MAG: DNA-binding transcriptional LysR family regulator [Pseudohongiellaceae bacterium]|jgi:DNA-binding transcriptional LysR family regulator
MKNLINLEAIEVLDAIDRKGSFAAAANKLNKVPSALSYTIQKLEQDLSVTLFQKQGRRSVLTNAGLHLLTEGRLLLAAAEQLSHSTQQVASGWEPRLRIACDTVIATSWLYPLLDKLYAMQPNIEIELSEEALAGTWEALIENRADLIIGAIDKPPRHQGIRCIKWFESEMCLVASPNHPICQQAQPLSKEAIAQHRSIIVHDSSKNLPTLNRGILNQHHYIHVPSMGDKINAHREGLGIGLVPKQRVQEDLQQGRLIELTMAEPAAITQLNIAWKTTNRGQALQWMVEQLQTIQPHIIQASATTSKSSPGKNFAIGVPKRTGILKI